MRNKADVYDIFAFSRGGLTVIASHVAAPLIAGDRINQARDEQMRRARAARRNRNWDTHDTRPGSAGMPQAA